MDVVSESFESWYRREHPRLLGLLCVATGDVDAAAEATDEAFARALAHWKRVSRMESPSGWTYRVALNHVRKRFRSLRRERRHVDSLATGGEPPSSHPEVWEAVRALPDRQCQAVLLRYVADLTEADIATVMHIRRGTVASLLHSARKRLGELLEADAVETETT